MTTKLAFEAQPRQDFGKAYSKSIRRDQGLVPVVVYGHNQPVQHFLLTEKEVLHALKGTQIFNEPIQLRCEKQNISVKLHAIQRHPVKTQILHMDFMYV